MSKRSRAQREIERAARERLMLAQADPAKVTFPESCSSPGPCHRKAILAIVAKKGHGEYQGWSACRIHVATLAALFEKVAQAYDMAAEAVASGVPPAILAEPKSEPASVEAPASQ